MSGERASRRPRSKRHPLLSPKSTATRFISNLRACLAVNLDRSDPCVPRKPRAPKHPPSPAPADDTLGQPLPPPPAWVFDENAPVRPLPRYVQPTAKPHAVAEGDDSPEADAPPADAPVPLPPSPPRLVHRGETRGLWLYHGNTPKAASTASSPTRPTSSPTAASPATPARW